MARRQLRLSLGMLRRSLRSRLSFNGFYEGRQEARRLRGQECSSPSSSEAATSALVPSSDFPSLLQRQRSAGLEPSEKRADAEPSSWSLTSAVTRAPDTRREVSLSEGVFGGGAGGASPSAFGSRPSSSLSQDALAAKTRLLSVASALKDSEQRGLFSLAREAEEPTRPPSACGALREEDDSSLSPTTLRSRRVS